MANKKKNNDTIVKTQKEVDNILKNGKEKKLMDKKVPTIIPIILAIIAIAAVSAVAYYYHYETKVKIVVSDNLTLESGSTIPTPYQFFEQTGALSEDATVSYKNTNKDVENRDNLITITKYFDKDGKEVARDDAVVSSEDKEEDAKTTSKSKSKTKESAKSDAKEEIKDSEEEELNDGYTKKVFLKGTYSYDVTIKDNKTGKEYKSKLTLKDTTAPVLTTKDVEITEGDEVKATDFFKECNDNSYEACGEIYFVKEVKTEDKEEDSDKKEDSKTEVKPTYEETKDIDTSVGEHEILLQVKDASGNVSEVSKAKLKVNEKPEEPEVSSAASTGRSSGSTGRSYSGGSSRSYSGGNSGGSGGSSTASSGGSACGSAGYSANQSIAYAWWGCGGGSSPSGEISNAFNYGTGKSALIACENSHGGTGNCADSLSEIPIIDNATGTQVGVYVKVTYIGMNSYAGQVLGTGYLTRNGIQWISKQF